MKMDSATSPADIAESIVSILEGYCKRGWKLFPCRSKTAEWTDRNTGEVRTAAAKTPLVSAWPQVAMSDSEQIKKWREQYPGCMWAVATGKASGFWALDLDTHDGADGAEEFKKYRKAHGKTSPQTLTQRTAGGGWHLLFKWQDGVDVRNATAILPGVDVRGDGGYIIISPSVNHDTGKVYQWKDAGAEIADAPDWLVELVTQKGKQTSAPDTKATQTGAQAACTWGCTPYGLQALHDEIAMLRAAEQGTRNDTLNRCAVKLYALCAGGELDTDTVTAELEAAASTIGLTYSEISATLASARKAGYASPRKAPALETIPVQETQTPGAWDAPIPFSVYDLPKLDTNNLPSILGDYCAGIAEEKQVPVELVLAMALAAVSIAAQAGYVVKIREGYKEPLNLYCIAPLEPANRKSAVVEAVAAPLRQWERDAKEQLEPEYRRAKSIRLTMEEAIKHKRSEAAKAKDPDKRDAIQKEIEELESDLPSIPVFPRLLCDNSTPEALATLMCEQGGVMGILTAEGGVFDILAGMYSRGVPNLDLFLKAYSGDAFYVDRKTAIPVILDYPRLALGISPQPITLAERTASKLFRARGLDARFLYFMPESLLGRRKLETDPIDRAIKERFERRILSLLPSIWENDRPEPVSLEMSADAYSLWLDFSGVVEKALAPGGEFEELKDWGGKLSGNVARIAGIFHLVTHEEPEKKKISDETMRQACFMGGFLTEHAKAAYALMGTDETIEGAKKVLAWIRRTAAEKFERQDCWQATKGTFHHMPLLKAALDELEERNYIREIPPPVRTGAGRKAAPSYHVNPIALKG